MSRGGPGGNLHGPPSHAIPGASLTWNASVTAFRKRSTGELAMQDQDVPPARRVIGLTGMAGSGKSWLADRIQDRVWEGGGTCTVLRVDDLRKYALKRSVARRHVAMRARLAERFGLHAWGHLATVPVRHVLGAAFGDASSLAAFTAITSPVLFSDVSRLLRKVGGAVILESATLLEDGLHRLVGPPVVLVTCPGAEIERRIAAREIRLGAEVARKIRSLQMPDPCTRALARSMGVDLDVVETRDREASEAAAVRLAGSLVSLPRLQQCPAPTVR